jgi:hypothetical protein
VIDVHILGVCRLPFKTTETEGKKKQYKIKRGKINTSETRKCWMGAYVTYLELSTGKDK